MKLRNVTLEMSLKPFKEMTPQCWEQVCHILFNQWAPLIDRADMVSVLLWIADGSEILTYRGDSEQEIEWAKYIGGANPRQHIPNDPEGKALHSRWYLYMDNPPRITYGNLKEIIATIKRVGQQMTGKPVRVGETFDPGPEFAKSPFKYELHNEICLSGTMGHASFICCYTSLNADNEKYAGFPEGIPDKTPFGTFLGRQSQLFMVDCGFDFIWFSNGFGFGMETWGTTGAIFDGKEFHPEKSSELRQKIIDFWRFFREECPDFPIETRGSNLTTGIDLVSDAVPLKDIYQGGFKMTPPPNSPWAALNGDFGFELAGYMSHIAKLPEDTYPFRFYVHDPWWLNSPWLDRYEREPHDIYLPLSVAHVDSQGKVINPRTMSILTVDDSYGNLPDKCPLEVMPHLLTAMDDAPDEPGPFIWIYPFDEYHEMAFGPESRLEEVFFGDWFIRAAINNGLPLNTVISSDNFIECMNSRPELWRENILVTITPDAGKKFSEILLRYIRSGGKAILYGPLTHAAPELLEAAGVRLFEPVSGDMSITLSRKLDDISTGYYSRYIRHDALLTGGGVCECLAQPPDANTLILATLATTDGERIAGVYRQEPDWNGGGLAWVRGTDTCSFHPGAHLLSLQTADKAFPGGALMRLALSCFGYDIFMQKHRSQSRTPITCITRHENGFYFSGYVPDMTVALHLRFPQGAPLITGYETELCNGQAMYHLPRAWHKECRVFIDNQKDGFVTCNEQCSVEYGIMRRIFITGLQDATVRFYPVSGFKDRVSMLVNPAYPYMIGDFREPETDDSFPGCLTLFNITGSLLISW